MRQQHSYATEAIILKRSDLGEADRVVTLFTPARGRYRAVAKGIRRTISKKAGHLELLSHSQLQMALGRNLDIVTQAEVRENFLHLRLNLWHMTCALYLAELVDRFVEENTPHADIYTLLLQMLRSLDSDAVEIERQRETETLTTVQERSRSLLLLRYFEIQLLSSVGYEPSFQQCASCSNELKPEENGFSASLGGALCPQCSRLWARSLSLNGLKVLRLLQRNKWSAVPQLRLDERLYGELEFVMHGLIRYHLERDMKSWTFLDMLRLNQ